MRSTRKDPVLVYSCKTCGPEKFPPRPMPLSVGRVIMRRHYETLHANENRKEDKLNVGN